MNGPLKLEARTPEDLAVISAVLQDATLRVGDIAWLRGARRFAAVLNRYRWETGADERSRSTPGERVRAGLHVDFVLRTASRYMPRHEPDHVLDLLAIRVEPGEDLAARIDLVFAGGPEIRLDVEYIEARLVDLTPPWRARRRPEHVME